MEAHEKLKKAYEKLLEQFKKLGIDYATLEKEKEELKQKVVALEEEIKSLKGVEDMRKLLNPVPVVIERDDYADDDGEEPEDPLSDDRFDDDGEEPAVGSNRDDSCHNE